MSDWVLVATIAAVLAAIALGWVLGRNTAAKSNVKPPPDPAMWRTEVYRYDGPSKKLRADDEFDLPDWVRPTPGRTWGRSR
jgi:hypothetical protein